MTERSLMIGLFPTLDVDGGNYLDLNCLIRLRKLLNEFWMVLPGIRWILISCNLDLQLKNKTK